MKRIFIISCLLFALGACEDDLDNHPILSLPVYLELDMNTPRDKDLKGSPSHCTYTDKNKKEREFIGFGGVLVVNTIFNEYKAFDLACPFEAKRGTLIEVQEDYSAVCPACGSKFDVILDSSSGMCTEGKAKYQLRPYTVTRTGTNTLVVRNNN